MRSGTQHHDMPTAFPDTQTFRPARRRKSPTRVPFGSVTPFNACRGWDRASPRRTNIRSHARWAISHIAVREVPRFSMGLEGLSVRRLPGCATPSPRRRGALGQGQTLPIVVWDEMFVCRGTGRPLASGCYSNDGGDAKHERRPEDRQRRDHLRREFLLDHARNLHAPADPVNVKLIHRASRFSRCDGVRPMMLGR